MKKSFFLHKQELTTDLTPDRISEEFFQKPYFFLLESSLAQNSEFGGRYTIAAFEPSKVIQVEEDADELLKELQNTWDHCEVIGGENLPFVGGWIGYLAYEFYSVFEKKVPERKPDLMPRAVFCFYDNFYVYDHQEKKAYFCSLKSAESPSCDPSTSIRMSDLFSGGKNGDSELASEAAPFWVEPSIYSKEKIQSNFSKEDYLAKIQKIRNDLAAGDCYQVNLAQKFQVPTLLSSYELYRNLCRVSPAPYAAYLNLGSTQIISSSPECFFRVDEKKITTHPIKGTRRRGNDEADDEILKTELMQSAKDKAELLMITDLERNDLGHVCKPGSIHVPELGRVETYPQVHHLVSTVSGELAEGRSIVDVIRALFPGGSITGAPKIQAMQKIHELELDPRNVYCGAIGFVSFNQKSEFNIAIRTMVLKDSQAHFWSGGGIVADSDPEKEFEETLVKARGMLQALRAGEFFK